MFRIDRRFVKLTNNGARVVGANVKIKREADAPVKKYPEAAALTEDMPEDMALDSMAESEGDIEPDGFDFDEQSDESAGDELTDEDESAGGLTDESAGDGLTDEEQALGEQGPDEQSGDDESAGGGLTDDDESSGEQAAGEQGQEQSQTGMPETDETSAPAKPSKTSEQFVITQEEIDALAAKRAEELALDLADEYIEKAQRDITQQEKEILDSARESAAKTLQDAQSEAENIRKKAHEEGFAQGEAEGKKVYDEKLTQQLESDMQQFKAVLDEVAAQKEQLYNEIEDDTVALAIELVRKIFNPAERELKNVYLSLLKNAVQQISTDTKIEIRVSASEYERLFSNGIAKIELSSGNVVTATVLRDIALEEGALIIDADDVTINAGLDTQLKLIQLAFEKVSSGAKTDPEISSPDEVFPDLDSTGEEIAEQAEAEVEAVIPDKIVPEEAIIEAESTDEAIDDIVSSDEVSSDEPE